MRKIIALLVLGAFLALAAACAKKDPYESYNRAINRSNEGHAELERSVK